MVVQSNTECKRGIYNNAKFNLNKTRIIKDKNKIDTLSKISSNKNQTNAVSTTFPSQIGVAAPFTRYWLSVRLSYRSNLQTYITMPTKRAP